MADHPRLVALRLEGDALASAIQAIWSSGDAAFPIDPALTESELLRLLALARPDRILDETGERDLPDPLGVDEGVLVTIATSGTTGEPRVVELTRSALESSARASAARIGAEPGDRWLCCLPLYHIAGIGILVRAGLTGTPPVILDRFDVSAFEAQRDVTLVSLVPTMLQRLLDADADLGRFRVVLLGGAHVPGALARRARDAGVHVVQTYGMSETSGGCIYDGRPLDGVDVRAGDVIELRGPVLMRGYRGRPDLTQAAFDEQGWFATSDVGELKAGRLVVTGRIDDMITTGGKKVVPVEVEDALRGHPLIADVAVFGEPDDMWGERVVVAVVAPDRAPSLEDIRSWLRSRLAAYKLPRELVVLESIPRTEHGKLRRRELNKRVVE